MQNVNISKLYQNIQQNMFGIVSLDESQCTRKICRRRFFGTKKPPEIKTPVKSCQEAKSSYIIELKEKLKLRKFCWETMFGQELVKLTGYTLSRAFVILSSKLKI